MRRNRNTMSIKDLREIIVGEHRRVYKVRCEVEGCDNKTKEGKPWCSDHVENSPYLAEIIRKDKAALKEIREVAKKGSKAIDLNGVIVSDFMLVLKQKISASLLGLARECYYLWHEEDIDRLKLMETYARKMSRNRLVVWKKTRRPRGGILTLHQSQLTIEDMVGDQE